MVVTSDEAPAEPALDKLGSIDNTLLTPQEIRRPLVSPLATVNTAGSQAPRYFYDIPTTAGNTYTLTAI